MRLLTIADIRQIELTAEPHPGVLMYRAGQAAAQIILDRLHFPHLNYVFFIGPGHNGGDGWLCAYWLACQGCCVSLYDPYHNRTWEKSATAEIRHWILNQPPYNISSETLPTDTVIIDALFGIGFNPSKALDTHTLDILSYIGQHNNHTVIALDVPSTVNADTGRAGHAHAVRADITITFIAPTPGLFTSEGKSHAGEVICASLALEEAVEKHPSTPTLSTNTPDLWPHLPRERTINSHKGTHGHLLIIGGAEGMLGAPLLSARAAIHTGIGKCFLYYPDPNQALSVDLLYPEILIHSNKRRFFTEAFLNQMHCFAIGPGLSTLNYLGTPIIKHLLKRNTPCILDADALNLMSIDQGLADLCAIRTAVTILTPHPKEAARLLHCQEEEVNKDPLSAAEAISTRYQAHVLLKGAGSILYSQQGQCRINAIGKPNLATGGTGDLLTGMIAALITEYRTEDAFDCLCYAVYLHSSISEHLYANGYQHGLPSAVFLNHLQQRRSVIA